MAPGLSSLAAPHISDAHGASPSPLVFAWFVQVRGDIRACLCGIVRLSTRYASKYGDKCLPSRTQCPYSTMPSGLCSASGWRG
ncbi:hypothetical protein DFH08DRAFT_974361 [Mycena albidolilacea]|uniref:Uncharacterized protein n=1 Tax=Mycena albidolilacea TaxID=1033008 RepID=A0AAD6Z7J7_9AGAR|nr:hypothetical protein DFH08DRAFT_974361 [Mycena albidolilacea]